MVQLHQKIILLWQPSIQGVRVIIAGESEVRPPVASRLFSTSCVVLGNLSLVLAASFDANKKGLSVDHEGVEINKSFMDSMSHGAWHTALSAQRCPPLFGHHPSWCSLQEVPWQGGACCLTVQGHWFICVCVLWTVFPKQINIYSGHLKCLVLWLHTSDNIFSVCNASACFQYQT